MKISARRGVQRLLLGTLVAGLVLTVLAAPSGAAGHAPSAAPVNQTAPSISGVAEYGRVLTANPGTWQPANSTFTYSWRRDGGVIAGAAGSTYRIVATDINHRLSVQVVAHDGIGGTTAANSANTALVAPGRFVQRTRPAISGVRRWGRTLTGYAGSWTPAPTRVYYRWFRNGRPIRGAIKRKYTLSVYDFGKRIRVRILLKRPNYRSTYAYSGSTGPIDHRVRLKKTFTYSISTRGRITTSVKEFARLAAGTYADPRGWRAGGYGFRRVAHGGSFTLVLAAAGSVPSFSSACSSQWSCRVGRFVVINQERWKHASPAWNAAHLSLRSYRHMVVNHETGHWLGHRHRGCPGRGQLAPVMMQQSKSRAGCRFNPFPLPSERWAHR